MPHPQPLGVPMTRKLSRYVLAVASVLSLTTETLAETNEKDCAPKPWADLSAPSAKPTGSGFTPHVLLQARVEDSSPFTLDKFGTAYAHAPALNSRMHVGLTYQSGLALQPLFLKLEYGHDLVQGVVVGGARNEGLTYGPNADSALEHQLRKAFATVALKRHLVLGAGVTTSDWGMGLLANSGDRQPAAGSAAFADPRGGDIVARVLLAGGFGSTQLFVAADQVLSDDVLLEGDEATQLVAGAKYKDGESLELGIYGVHRQQKSNDAKATTVNVIDAYAKSVFEMNDYLKLIVEGEFAAIFGTTELGPSPDFPTHDVLQLGGALRLTLDANYFGGVLDVLYASGDRDFEDGQQNAFKADFNYEMGLLLFRHVMAAQSARFPETASDPDLSGYPNEDLDRLPTRGAVTNTLAFFPRAWWRPVDGLEVYGGPLIALAAVDYSDPLNTKLNGGDNHSPLNAPSAGYLGTEIDLGIRYRTTIAKTHLTLGLEGALFFPGAAFDDAAGTTLDLIYGGRGLVSYAF